MATTDELTPRQLAESDLCLGCARTPGNLWCDDCRDEIKRIGEIPDLLDGGRALRAGGGDLPRLRTLDVVPPLRGQEGPRLRDQPGARRHGPRVGGTGPCRKKRRYGEPSYHVSVRLHQEERDALVSIAEARNCTASVVVSELLLEEGPAHLPAGQGRRHLRREAGDAAQALRTR